MKKAIPHIFTLSNLLCGVLSIRAIYNEEVVLAIVFVSVAALLDFLDGMVARLLGVSGELGKQLDSLADNVTFGVVPAIMYLSMGGFLFKWPVDVIGYLMFGGSLLVAAMATLRLAKFNIDSRQTGGFIGMPTPGNTLFVASIYYMFFQMPDSLITHFLSHQAAFVLIILFTAIWQIIPVQLIALKFKSWGWKGNQSRYIFLVLSAVAILIHHIEAIPIVILLYLIISIAQTAINKDE